MTKTFVLQNDVPAKDFKVNYQKELNDEQFRAVTEGEGPCLVLAGAGSGKTRTIVYRVAYLIERGVNPENILLVTFTNKAAHQMLTRVEELLGYFPSGLWGGTFHHIGNRILRKYAKVLGFESNFTILDEEDAKSLLKVCLREEDIDTKSKRFPSPAVLKELISFGKNSEIALEEVIDTRHPKWLKISDTIVKIARRYEEKKSLTNSMDFDDLLLNWLKLLKQFPETRDRLGAQFQYILVDEYQDTNYLQAEIIKELAQVHHNVLVVGDDAQSIYSFRAADIGNILNFPKVFEGAKIFKLENNYRSSPEILDVANSVIENNRNQFAKTLRPMLPAAVKPNLIPANSAAQEAQFIVAQILQLKTGGLPLNKIAVLFRAAYHSQELEFALTKQDILYEYRGGVRFFERAQVKDALAFLKVINNPADEVAWLRILNLQAGVGEATASKIYQVVKGYTDIKEIIASNLGSALGAKAGTGWQGLIGILKKAVSSQTGPFGIAEMVRALAKSDYRNYLEAEYPNWQDRLDDLEQLAVFSERYEDLTVFLSEMSLQESFALGQERPSGHDDNRIVLSTIHQAKGLEWQAVFVINLVDTAFPNQRAMSEEGGLEEERRLFYVAITRAQKHLYLSYPLMGGYNSFNLNTPSKFITEIEEGLLEEVKLLEKFRSSGFALPSNGGQNIWQRKDLNDGNVSYLPDLDSL
ncbi:MAG: ATP-dependent helicase [Candidatus Komeilibacteria bacterium]|nr:ATP-dependent helicase [Candidatus Komeilibacteria bacterium]